MDCVSPILYIATRLWDCTVKHSAHIHNLEENLNSLRGEMAELKHKSEDVKTRVELAEQENLQHTNEVEGWLQCVEVIEKEVDDILEKGDQEMQKKCLGSCCPKNCRSIYKLGKMASQKRSAIEKLTNRGHFNTVAVNLPSSLVDEMPMEGTVGLDSIFPNVWRCLTDTGIIGIHGMGGVGKTTLLKKIYNKFSDSSHNFNAVIWVVVSKGANLEKIQEVIRKKINISDDIWMKKIDETERATIIHKFLKKKKFVLLLDDLWEQLDLIKVGVPCPTDHNGSKVVFTTRSEEVCSKMHAQRKFVVKCLPQKDALDLFRKNVGEFTLNSHPDIRKLAEDVAEECKGLPLALITIGRAMASKTEPEEWRRAKTVLQKNPSRLATGIETEVFCILKLSYDYLKDDTLKKCFLYCSMFPEDYNIRERDLIELWTGEGFLDKYGDIYEARNEGQFDIIKSLKRACLLESGEPTNEDEAAEDFVRMHDVIRDMALWISRELGEKENKILVSEDDGFIKAQGLAKWKEAERISLWGQSITYLTTPQVCPYLKTLIIRDTNLEAFPSEFFQSMHALEILDLSNNYGLIELPVGIAELINLRYLNLSSTFIKEIPFEFQKLKNLRSLRMDDMLSYIIFIPRDVISSLSLLRVSGQVTSQGVVMDEREMLEELESSENINDIGVSLTTLNSVQKLLNSPKLQSCISQLLLSFSSGVKSLNISSSLGRIEHLERLTMIDCYDLEELKIYEEKEERILERLVVPDEHMIPNRPRFVGHEYFRNLQFLYIFGCPKIKDLTWLTYAPSLQSLELRCCKSMEDVIGEDFGSAEIEENLHIFSNLRFLRLFSLPMLKSICRQALPFSSLRKMKVIDCPSLRKLPFDSNSAKNHLKEINARQEWWNNLKWEDEAIKHSFDSKFKGW